MVQQTGQTGTLVVSPPIVSAPYSAAPSRINELTNFVPPFPSQESSFPHELIFDNVHEDPLGRAPISSVLVEDDTITCHLTSAAQASTSGRYETDLAKLKEDLAGGMKTKLGVDVGNSRLYQKPYPAEFDLVSYPTGWSVPDFVKFSVDDSRTPWEHIS